MHARENELNGSPAIIKKGRSYTYYDLNSVPSGKIDAIVEMLRVGQKSEAEQAMQELLTQIYDKKSFEVHHLTQTMMKKAGLIK